MLPHTASFFCRTRISYIEIPTLIRHGKLTNDEFFVAENAARKGITLTNTSLTETIVTLKHFAENLELVIE